MCLDTITQQYEPPNEEVKVGYKYFRELSNGLVRPPAYGACQALEKWYDDPKNDILFAWITPVVVTAYQTGFHVLVSLSQAKAFWIGIMNPIHKIHLYKVEYRNVVASGTDDGADVDVARSIRVIEKLEDVNL